MLGAVGSTRIIGHGGGELARITAGVGPVVTFALHAGHAVRPGVAGHLALTAKERRREEDPFTASFAPIGTTLVEAARSRFEVDLNRPRFRCVYQGPEDAWGLQVYRGRGLPDDEDRISRAAYDAFYASAFDLLSDIEAVHGRFVVLDLHSYNHRRGGPGEPVADPADNPEVNLGTGSLDPDRWGAVIAAFSSAMTVQGLDCRENVKFTGGHFSRWVTETFPRTGCALAIEFKKTYMDEWSGLCDEQAIERGRSALSRATDAVVDVLENT